MKQPAGRAAVIALAVLGLLWAGLVAGDWGMRFRWFQWHRTLVQGPARPTYLGYAPPLTTNHVPARRGGDLLPMLGVPSLMERYAEPIPAYTQINDEYGLPNQPPVTPDKYPVVMVGDSYLLQGGDQQYRPAGQLAARLGCPVYTVSMAGFGPVVPLTAYMDHPVFRDHPPRVVVWNVIERDVGGPYFEGMLYNVLQRAGTNTVVATPTPVGQVNWRELGASRLRARLPETSLAAQLARRVWARLRYLVFGLIVPEVSISTQPVLGRDMLFYYGSLVPRCWDSSRRDLPRVTRTIRDANEAYFKPRGIHWVILLIPDKETIYEEFVPPRAFPCGVPPPPSCLTELDTRLRAAGLTVVNLLPAYREAAQAGRLLYGHNDTHWNREGMALAADQLAGPVLELLAEKP